MHLSGRQATRLLTLPPTSLTERSARRVLACGVAGAPQIGGSTWLYDREAIAALKARPVVSAAACAQRFPGGIFVSRREVDARWPAERRRAALAARWPIGLATQALLVIQITQNGFVPMVATIAGFVVDGFDITALADGGRGNHDFTLDDAGLGGSAQASAGLGAGVRPDDRVGSTSPCMGESRP